jgi:predicted RNase H-like HicB family nuclease
MLLDYIQAAMGKATYELLPDSEGFYAEIPGLQGVWANAPTLEGCRRELQEVVESWLIVKLRHGDPLPVLDGIDLNARTTSDAEVA